MEPSFRQKFWGIKNPELFQHSLTGIRQSILSGNEGFFASDQLITFHRNLSFFRDSKFITSWKAHAADAIEEGVIWRRAVHYWAARHCLKLEGDFVECGVWKGTTVRIIYDAVDFGSSGKNYWLYDAFDFKEGDKHHALDGLEPGLYDKVVERFSFAHNVKVITGYIPESFAQGMPEAISLLHIDMNNVDGEMAALEILWDRVVDGGIILLDDYGWLGYKKQMLAESDFFEAMNHSALELPTGQGIVIKHSENKYAESSIAMMIREVESGPPIYRPMGIWKEFIQRNDMQWRVAHNFKRGINSLFSYQYMGDRDHRLYQRILELTDTFERKGEVRCDESTDYFHGIETARNHIEYVIRLNLWVRHKDPFALVEKIEEPLIGNPLRIFYNEHLVSIDIPKNYLDLLSIQSAFQFGRQERISILELGGGYGALAYCFNQGFNVRYFLVNIPHSLHIAQSYLSRVLPNKKVFLFRHFDAFEQISEELQDADLAFFTPNQMELLPDKLVDICLNINSFGDMEDQQVQNFLQLFSRLSRLGIWSRNSVSVRDKFVADRRDEVSGGKWLCPEIENYKVPGVKIEARAYELDPTYTEMVCRLTQ